MNEEEVIPIHMRASILPKELAALRRFIEFQKAQLDQLDIDIPQLNRAKDAAYNERNRLVALLAAIYPASLERHTGEDWGPDWQWVCIIDLPTGQVSWHIQTSELELFNHVRREAGRKWDGHTNDVKWDRVSGHITEITNE